MREEKTITRTHENIVFPREARAIQLQIRRSRYDDRDYEAAVSNENAIYPEHPQDVQSWRYWDSNREARYLYRRYIGEVNGKVVASADLGHTSWSYQPGKYLIFVAVDPRYQ
ncbi:MAG TPA: hypothetical protein VE553_09470, partial [Candidatus Binatia bacterium]|nr:hypothetical protein [Candidatus Binatia bacterium]